MRAKDFSLGARPNGRKSRPKAESGFRVLGEGRGGKPFPPARRSEERCELPQWCSGWSTDRPKVFHYH